MTQTRLAVIGVGDVAQRDYLPELHRLADRAQVSVVCGRDPERVRRVAAEYEVPRWSTDYREVLDDQIDAVINLTPAIAHFDVNLAALRAGRHVYSEKPFALSSSDAGTLAREAYERSLVFVCAPSIMLFPQIELVRELLASGELGSVCSARAHAITGVPPWAGYHSDPSPYFRAETGPLFDMAVYPLHVLTGLLGPATAVAAMARHTRDSFTIAEGPYHGKVVPMEGEDEWQLILELGQCLASVETSFATVASSAPECELRGDSGAVAFSLLDVAAPVSIMRSGRGGWQEHPVQHERSGGPDHILGIEELIDCISTGRAPLASAAHATHVIDVIGAARRAARSGASVQVDVAPDISASLSAATVAIR